MLNDHSDLAVLDLDADWDPEAHDKQMDGLYGEEDEDGDMKKPVWDDDIDIGDLEPAVEDTKKSKKKKKKKKAVEVEDEGVDMDVMDADAEQPEVDDEEWDGTEEMRKRKLDEYMDEIYALDFNDMVRFLYLFRHTMRH